MDEQEALSGFSSPSGDINTCDFGCCSRYRECSDARRCLAPDIGHGCMYRRNLEAGRIFYGRNSIYFDPAKYAEITSLISGFSTGALDALDKVLSYICEYRRAATSCVIRNQYVYELSSLGVFEIKPLGALFPLYCSSKSLFSLVQSNESCLSAFREAQAKRKEENKLLPDGCKLPGIKTKEFLSSWLNTGGAVYRDEMAEPYRILYKRLEHTTHVEELYRERFPFSRSDRMYSMSPLAEDGLLLPSQIKSEEERLAQWMNFRKE